MSDAHRTDEVAYRARVEALFEEALDRETADREAWLSHATRGDATLAAAVRALLRAHDGPDGILGAKLGRMAVDALEPPPTDRRIGAYRIVRELGRGGMGVVYLAERSDGQFERQVALKLLRTSSDGDTVRRRFLAERQILATLSHPHIAQLLDGGVTDGGLPFLVMEFVDGVPITTYCAREGLSVDARLTLFLDVCDAVEHAHRKLVLHRDLKPGNIVVDRTGRATLLDFGIAKLLHPVTPDGGATVTAGRPMTPAYASPEQMRGDALSTASDVYALGLVLYELLAGSLPYRLDGCAPAAALALVCDVEPPRPSARVALGTPSTVSTPLPEPPLRLARTLRGDLDAIVMCALRKDPRARYGSVAELARDIERFRQGLPVHAHASSRRYRLCKWLRRNRVPVAAAAVITLSLAGGAAVARWQARVAAQERDRARVALAAADEARRQSDEVAQFLVSLFEDSDPTEGRRDQLSAMDLVRRGAARADRLSASPPVQVRLLESLARVHLSLGDHESAAALAERAARLAVTGLDTLDPLQPATLSVLADVARRRGDYRRADSIATRALELRQGRWRTLAPSTPNTTRAASAIASPVDGAEHERAQAAGDVSASLRQLASIAVYRGELDRAVALMQEAIALRTEVPLRTDSLFVRDLELYGAVLWRRGHVADGVTTLRRAMQRGRDVFPDPSPEAAGLALRYAERRAVESDGLTEAIAVTRGALADLRQLLGSDHPRVAEAMQQLGALLARANPSDDEAEQMLIGAVSIMSRAQGPTHTSTAGAQGALARLYAQRGRLAEAEQLMRTGLVTWREQFGDRHSAYAGALTELGDVLVQRGRVEAGEQLHREALAIRREALGERNTLTAITRVGLARVLLRRGAVDEADALVSNALDVLSTQILDAHPDVRRAFGVMAEIRRAQGRRDESAMWAARADAGEAPTTR